MALEDIPRLNHTPVGWLIEALASAGLSRETIEETLNADGRQITGPGIVLPTEDYAAFFQSAAEAAGDAVLGLHIGENAKISDFSILGYLLENSPTVADWFGNLVRYHAAFARDAVFEIDIGKDRLLLEYRLNVSSEIPADQDILMVMAAVVAAMRRYLGPDWVPHACLLAFDPPGDLDEIRRVLGMNLKVNQLTNAISLTRPDIDQPIAGADPALLAILKQQAEPLVAAFGQDDDFVHRVKLIVASNLSDERFTMEETAGMLNMSIRKLHRRLAGLDMTYRQIRDDVIALLAREKLRNPELSITQVAHALGYSETSAFTRAFTRICGVSPTNFRAKALFDEFRADQTGKHQITDGR